MTASTVDSLSGAQIREMFAAATTWLERHVDQVNAANVFPVPDGDTGTNMFLTMRSTAQEAERCPHDTAGAILASMSTGALMGARGNSGVILSQIIRGVATAAEGLRAIGGAAFAAGLEEASAAAYRAVTKPAEGTMLTVIRDASEAVRGRIAGGDHSIISLLGTAVEAAQESVARTPALLPVLAEAGVVDAGGLGLSFLLEGMLRQLKGEPLDMPQPAPLEAVGQEWLAVTERRHATEDSLYGYCTELLISGKGLGCESIRERMLELGDSVLVVGDERLVRVHVHTDDPGEALTHGTSVGSLVQVKVDNIRKQAERFVQMHEQRAASDTEPPVLCSVAVVAGDGMKAVFESVGCSRIVFGGPTMNPSAREILKAVEACPSEEVVVLPNDKNIILAAEQAAALSSKRIHILPTRSMPQGIAALLAMNPEEGSGPNLGLMEEARQSVRTIEVTRAVRSTSIGGVHVSEGQCIALIDDQLKLAASSGEEAALEAVRSVAGDGTSLITLYYGADATEREASSLAHRLRNLVPEHEVEVVRGGQPHYGYIISVE